MYRRGRREHLAGPLVKGEGRLSKIDGWEELRMDGWMVLAKWLSLFLSFSLSSHIYFPLVPSPSLFFLVLLLSSFLYSPFTFSLPFLLVYLLLSTS